MILGAAWYGFGDQSPSNYFEMAASLGLTRVEIPLYGDSLVEWFRTGDDIDKVRRAADDAGVQVVSGVSYLSLAGVVSGTKLDHAGADFAMAQASRAIDVGRMMGAGVIRLAEPHRLEADQMHLAEPYMKSFGDAFRALGDYAGDQGIQIAIENFGFTSEQINEVLRAADHPSVGTLYDPCNYYRHGEDPLSALRSLRERIFYCHLKDAWYPYPAKQPDKPPLDPRTGGMKPWWWIRPLGMGQIDWRPILEEMSTFYTGYTCLEHDIRDEVMWGTRKSLEFVRQIAAELDIHIET